MHEQAVKRPDIDIAEDIRDFLRSYDPLKQARGHFSFLVEDGHVILTGNVRSMQARRVLVDNVPDIPGVVSMDEGGLFDDETIRLELGKAVPRGVLVRVNYGSVVVSFPQPLPNEAEIVEKVKAIPGVRAERVATETLY